MLSISISVFVVRGFTISNKYVSTVSIEITGDVQQSVWENVRGEMGLEKSGSATWCLVARFIRGFRERLPLFHCKKILRQDFLCICNMRYSAGTLHFIDNINLKISEINKISCAVNRNNII